MIFLSGERRKSQNRSKKKKELNMDPKELEKIWEEMVQDLWVEFAKKYLEYDPETKKLPFCHGSGDGSSYCVYCPAKGDC
jgi:hypothetical protein